jgi:hypothetical protein
MGPFEDQPAEAQVQGRLLQMVDLSAVSSEVAAQALRDAYDIGKEDGAKGVSDKAVQAPDADEDITRAYLKGWSDGAGPLSAEDNLKLEREGKA